MQTFAVIKVFDARIGDVHNHTQATNSSTLSVRLDLPPCGDPMDSAIPTNRPKLCRESPDRLMCFVDKCGYVLLILRVDTIEKGGQWHAERGLFRGDPEQPDQRS